MSHGMMDAVIIGIVLFLSGAAFMAICHGMLLLTRYFLEKLEKKP
jgi:hypothetical protein